MAESGAAFRCCPPHERQSRVPARECPGPRPIQYGPASPRTHPRAQKGAMAAFPWSATPPGGGRCAPGTCVVQPVSPPAAVEGNQHRRNGGRGSCDNRPLLLPGEEGGDVPQVVQRAQVFRLHQRGGRQTFLERRQDFDALDRINPQVRIEGHVQVEHLRRIACLFRDDLQQDILNIAFGLASEESCRWRRMCRRWIVHQPERRRSA